MRPLQLLWVAGAAAVPGQPKRECWFLPVSYTHLTLPTIYSV